MLKQRREISQAAPKTLLNYTTFVDHTKNSSIGKLCWGGGGAAFELNFWLEGWAGI